ncbi:MAG: rhombosortase [Burkholderiaceae bacterium]|nr:rhombosortase [Burkholderiaceae bacterium]
MARGLRLTRPWLIVAALAAAGALPAWFADPAALDWQPGRWPAQPWRAVTAAWVHLSALHLGANLVGAALVAALGEVAGCGRRAALAWALAWPLTHLALALQPALQHYGGLSGLMHAGVAVAAWQLLRAERGRRRAVGAALLAGMTIKLLLEAPWLGPLRQVPGWDIPIAPLAHTSGALAGLLCAWACGVGGDAARGRPPST